VRIESIIIKNFKVFDEREFHFHPQMNVIIGDNTTGKTTLLEALSYGVGTVFLGFNGVDLRPLRYEEKRRKIISLENIEIQLPFKIDMKHTLDGESYRWYRSTDKEKGGSTTYQNAMEMIAKAKELDAKVRNGEKVDLPLISYYGTDRVNDRNQTTKREGNSRFDGYYGALNQEVVRKQFLTWFRDYEDSVLKFGKEKGLYNAFTGAITNMVPNWNRIHFSWKAEDILGQHDDGSWSSFSMLSAGYKNIVRITADIAYRAIKLNPHLGELAIKETQGVVLIDEIDMHLHPKWQKVVIGDLKNTFPKIQFILTTHSPFIVQSLSADELINLDGEVSGDPYKKSIPDIAEEEMHLENVQRSKKFEAMQEVASHYFSLLKNGLTSKSDLATRELKKQLDDLELEFNSDPAFVALMRAERKGIQGA